MNNWSKNNRACTTTWTTLFLMGQLRENFANSGNLKIAELTFYNNLTSSELRKQEATMIADQLDMVFRVGRGAEYEEGFSRTKSIAKIVEILLNEDKTVENLAEEIDKCYLFWQENIQKVENKNKVEPEKE